MLVRVLGLVACVWLLVVSPLAAESKLTAVEKTPAGLSEKVAGAIASPGQQLVSDNGAICTVWLAKEVAAKPEFKPSLNVKYPFQAGAFVGVLQVDQKSGFTDFRGQEIGAGVYTLRYAQQPVDGNHVGTSELYDFLLAIPAAADDDPAPAKSVESLFGKSAKTTGSNHPGIFSLLPAAADDKTPAAIHDENKEFWILSLTAKGAGGKDIPVRLVVVGVSEG